MERLKEEHVSPPTEDDPHRREFLGAAAMALAAAELMSNGADAKPMPYAASRTPTSLGTIEQVHAGVLDVGYAEAPKPP